MPDVVIVGHGPSLIDKQIGDKIDTFDKVIRLKRCQETLRYPRHYGSKTSAVCGSYTIARALKQIPSPEYWVFLDSRHVDITDGELDELRQHFLPAHTFIDRELCDKWNQIYRDVRTPYDGPVPQMSLTRTSDPVYGHNHMSAGLHAILYACALYGIDDLHLAGFDNVKTGAFDWSITRGPDWDHYPDHRWDIERNMLGLIAEHYHVKIHFI
jgi:hypothetical protein